MAKGFELICPAKAETMTTGFLGGIQKEHKGRIFRVEFRRAGTVCTKNGNPIVWEALPHPIRAAAHAGLNMLNEARRMAE